MIIHLLHAPLWNLAALRKWVGQIWLHWLDLRDTLRLWRNVLRNFKHGLFVFVGFYEHPHGSLSLIGLPYPLNWSHDHYAGKFEYSWWTIIFNLLSAPFTGESSIHMHRITSQPWRIVLRNFKHRTVWFYGRNFNSRINNLWAWDIVFSCRAIRVSAPIQLASSATRNRLKNRLSETLRCCS